MFPAFVLSPDCIRNVSETLQTGPFRAYCGLYRPILPF